MGKGLLAFRTGDGVESFSYKGIRKKEVLGQDGTCTHTCAKMYSMQNQLLDFGLRILRRYGKNHAAANAHGTCA